MILFHSIYCEHCKQLLEAILRHDTNKIIKIVSIEVIKENGYNLDNNIHSVPCLYFKISKDFIYGKAVFDYLLLPGRGKLLVQNNTNDINLILKETENIIITEPLGFSINNMISQQFENILEEEIDNKTDLNFIWTPLNENIINKNTEKVEPIDDNKFENKKNIKSIETILSERAKDLI
jgi:hypothetical protein